jgi:peptidoglycan/LPS O-acetylase OafA/YrhL
MTTSPHEVSTAPKGHLAYRADIDGLRAVAVLMVVIYHAFPHVLPGGFIGVDVFFIISGYLISTILFQGIDAGTFSITDFYSRRIRRIFPALSVVLIATGFFGWFSLRADEFQQLGKHIAAGAGFVSNFVLWGESGYFDNAAETKPLLHLWSLGIEEQFYFFFPIFLWLAWRRRLNLLIVTSVIAVLSFGWNLYQYNTDTTALFYSPFTRFWELMIGSVLAYVALSTKKASVLPTTATAVNLRSLAGVALLIVGVVTAGRAYAFPGAWALFPTFGAALLISAGPSAFLNRHVLSNRFMVSVGLISYPLYLWHWPLLSYARIIEGRTPTASVRALCVVAAFVLAFLTFRFIERPLRFHVRQNSVAWLLASAVFLVGIAGYGVWAKDGFEGRSVDLREVKFDGDIGHVDFHAYVENKFFPCTPESVRDQAEKWEDIVRCSQSRDDKPIDTVLLGDSHAEHLFIGIAESLPEKNVAFYIRNGMSVRSNPGFNAIFEAIDANPDIKQVIIASLWSLRQIPIADMIDTIRSLQVSGKKVFITDDTPDFSFDPALCKFKGECTENASSFMDRYNTYQEALGDVVDSAIGVELVRTSEYLCDSTVCKMGDNGKLYYRDPNHLSIPGSQFIGAEMIRRHPQLAE